MATISTRTRIFGLCRPLRYILSNKNVSRCLSSDLLKVLESNSEKFAGEVDATFQDKKVQDVLCRIIERNIDLDNVFKARKEALEVPTYKLMTDEEFVEAEANIRNEAKKRLKMPPVMKERKEIDMIIKEDTEIDGHDESNFVFTDISTSCNDRNRRIVVREPNGVLREATWHERERMNFIYFPREGQSYELQPMLTDEYLPVVFDQMRHVDVLDLVCLQCAADSPDYIRVYNRTYDDIDSKRLYYVLESTRYHGGMIFHYISHKRIRGYLAYLVKEDRIDDASDIVKLFHIIHPESEAISSEDTKGLDGRDLLMAFAQQRNIDEILQLLSEKEIENSTQA
eukprot:gene15386-16965_t